jgi:hypothetical protein
MAADDISQAVAHACERAFHWVGDLGFRKVASPDGEVEYRSPNAYLLIACVPASDRNTALIEARIGALDNANDTTQGYSIREIVKHLQPGLDVGAIRRELGPARFPAPSATGASTSVDRLAAEWRRALERVDLGDDDFWAALREEKLSRTLSMARDDARERAIAAFAEGDYAAAIALYERVPGELRPADHKRLEIARQRVNP